MFKRFAQGATTLPQEYFTSPEMFASESERIFARSWLCAGRSSALPQPGSFLLANLLGESIILTRDSDRTARAFYNVCRHRGTRLCTEPQGQFSGKIQCPYHTWTYSLSGELIGAPNMKDVRGFDRSAYPLHSLATAEWEGFLFINLSETPEPFEIAFAPLLERFQAWRLEDLRIAHSTTYEVNANWKLIFQNYNECYHCPTVHPLLAKLTPYKSALNHLDEGPFLGGPMQISMEGGSMTMDGHACASALCEDEKDVVHYYTLFPSMFLSLHPDYVLVHRLERIQPDLTRIQCEWLFHPDAMIRADFDPNPAIEFWDLTNKQDWNVCELSQKGIGSRAYVPGPYSNLESLLAAFDREYLRAMNPNIFTAEDAEIAERIL
ncbi:aromatic ring-hydroxylating dioxygenase subunit alpha [bacterium]|nr:aromatic ring-hydroxylating dioxygenase subunit alpha [bacterium]MCI0606272.1 aromatic ring-hydroxylating dioxygenase subunit alpha [bacterium]